MNLVKAINKTQFMKLLPLFIIGMMFTVNVFAGISIKPSVTEILFKQSGMYEGEAEVENTFDKDVEVNVIATDWSSAKIKELQDIGKWLVLNETKFMLEPGATKKVKYLVYLDEAAVKMNGERFAQVFFGVQQGQITSRVGMALYLASVKTAKFSAQVKNLKIYYHQDEKSKEKILILEASVSDNGNVHIRPAGKVAILDSNNKEAANFVFGAGAAIFPKETKPIFGQIKDPKLQAGKYTARLTLNYAGTYNVEKSVVKNIKFSINEKGEIGK